MPITNAATLNTALPGGQFIRINKAGPTAQNTGEFTSYFRSGTSGFPAQPAAPTNAEICNEATPGGMVYTQPAAGKVLYLAGAQLQANGITNFCPIFCDRLGQMGGLAGNITTLQTVSLDISGTASNLAQRRGSYSDVLWWLASFSSSGSTSTTVTVNYTATDDTTGSVTVSLVGTFNVHRMRPIPRPADGKLIKRVDSLQLSISTGSAGNLGVVAHRPITIMQTSTLVGTHRPVGPMEIGLPVIHRQSCLEIFHFAQSSTGPGIGGGFKLIEG